MEELLTLPSGTPSLLEEQIREHLDKRIIIFNDSVDECLMENVILHILKWNREDKHLPKEMRKPIWIYLQSPGGGVISGFSLIDAIEASETPVYTVCFSECASMAFHIFISGHKRYAFKNSILLIHDGEVSISNSSSKAKDTMKFLNTLDSRVKNHVLTHTSVSPEFYDEVYNKEYFIYANDEGKTLNCVDFIIGEDVELSKIL